MAMVSDKVVVVETIVVISQTTVVDNITFNRIKHFKTINRINIHFKTINIIKHSKTVNRISLPIRKTQTKIIIKVAEVIRLAQELVEGLTESVVVEVEIVDLGIVVEEDTTVVEIL